MALHRPMVVLGVVGAGAASGPLVAQPQLIPVAAALAALAALEVLVALVIAW